jgi:hypothetical protein
VGTGLTVDFGKWASALGIETNYTKDQLNYSRSYWFNFLPFYHFGFRSSYDITKKVNLSYWLVNGVQQSEDFNNFKSQAILWNVKPTEHTSFNVNFYSGIEDRFPPRRHTSIFDSYINWSGRKVTLAAEGDYVRIGAGRVWGGAGYAAYQWAKHWRTAMRAEYLSDFYGLFSGVSQSLKEGTVSLDYRIADGALLRWEWRTDFSNQPFFLTVEPGVLKRQQSTIGLGMVWWFGPKQGAW